MASSIVEKLKLTKYKNVALLNVPVGSHYFDGISDCDTVLGTKKYDLIFSFVLDMQSLQSGVSEIIEGNYLSTQGYLYFAYPKKGNKVYQTFIHRDELLEGLGADRDGYIGNSTIKFSRMVGLDDVFTVVGLKEDSKTKNKVSTKKNQYVDDYIDYIPQIEQSLEDAPNLLAFYQSLTPGYKKDWARYVYSAKQDVTKKKRQEEMKKILAEGYKTRDLYKLGKK
ncbi:bacteriocin resistance YdeI/OmpD-like protein [Ureibacillus xyleni]|uniref:Bacteriocin resistance YdeI/OmpD-like protein n=1 Tax=Ureibacillus xyleni TaxID=614648 RepID=A0A285SM35_9BACL|nr:YdeI/OmpD-associated family protein [Ureibacillus xyleni]SOC08832.1 bacteriocin resistance YdeI/OmpD-like protein [Ureibacillus xyleni]